MKREQSGQRSRPEKCTIEKRRHHSLNTNACVLTCNREIEREKDIYIYREREREAPISLSFVFVCVVCLGFRYCTVQF